MEYTTQKELVDKMARRAYEIYANAKEIYTYAEQTRGANVARAAKEQTLTATAIITTLEELGFAQSDVLKNKVRRLRVKSHRLAVALERGED